MTDAWIDVHAHYTPPTTPEQREVVWRAMRAECFLAPEPYHWTVERTLAQMDRSGIGMQMLSNQPNTTAALRASNDYGADLVLRYPDRFGLLAALPTDDITATMAELDRAAELGADGFAVTCRRNGVYLSDPSLEPMWAELDRRGATVFAHPDAYAAGAQGRPAPLLEVGFETTRTIVDMLYAGVFREYPNMKLIVAHCGGAGALPAMSGRLRLLGTQEWVPNPNALTTDEIGVQLWRLYLDTAATGLPSCLTAALTMTTPDHLVYGSDSGVPCSTEDTIETSRKSLLEFDGLTPRQRQDIGRNAIALFPGAATRLDGTQLVDVTAQAADLAAATSASPPLCRSAESAPRRR